MRIVLPTVTFSWPSRRGIETKWTSVHSRGGRAASASGTAKALVKGLALVELVSVADAPVRLGDLVGASGLPRPTVLRLLDVLLEERLLQPAADGFALGPGRRCGAGATSTASTCARTRRT